MVIGISLDQNEMDTIAEYWDLLKLTEKCDKITGEPRLEMFSADDPTAYQACALSTQIFYRNQCSHIGLFLTNVLHAFWRPCSYQFRITGNQDFISRVSDRVWFLIVSRIFVQPTKKPKDFYNCGHNQNLILNEHPITRVRACTAHARIHTRKQIYCSIKSSLSSPVHLHDAKQYLSSRMVPGAAMCIAALQD